MEKPTRLVPSLLVTGAAVAALLVPSVVRAAPHWAGAGAVPPKTLVSVHRVSELQHAARLAPDARSRDVSAANAALLKATISVPGDLQLLASGGSVVADLSQLDNESGSNTSQFAFFHPAPDSYLQSGVQAAFAQNWVFETRDLGVPVFFTVQYLATVYSSDAAAANVESFLKGIIPNNNLSLVPCSGTDTLLQTTSYYVEARDFVVVRNPTCYVTTLQSTDTNGEADQEVYAFFTEGNVVAEIDIQPKLTDLNNVAPAEEKTLLNAYAHGTQAVTAAVENAVDAAVASGNTGGGTGPGTGAAPPTATNTPVPPTATPTTPPTATPSPTPVPQPQIQITQGFLGIQKKGKAVATTKFKSGVRSYYIIRAQYANAGSFTPTATISFIYKGKLIATKDMQRISSTSVLRGLLSRTHQTAGAPTVDFGDSELFKHFKKTVKLTALFNVKLGPATDSARQGFKIVPNCKGKVCK